MSQTVGTIKKNAVSTSEATFELALGELITVTTYAHLIGMDGRKKANTGDSPADELSCLSH